LKRTGVALLLLALAFGALLFWGKPPSRYVVSAEAARFQEERRRQFVLYTRAIAENAVASRPTAALKAELDRELFAPHELRLGGWRMVFLPPGAKAPKNDLRTWGEVDPAERLDSQPLRGTWTVRMEPLSWTARLHERIVP